MREKSTKLSLSCAAFLFLCMLACVVGVASARTIYVPDDYARIQWAVDNASAGDTIIVRDGLYYEHVNVNKQLTLKSENGSANCIVDAGGSGSPITLNADGISIERFTVRNSLWPNAGIKVYSSNNCIKGNNISNNYYGILLSSSSKNSITGNNISNNVHGISLYSSSENSIKGNNISNNDYCGIYLWYSSENSITGNNISNNDYCGIELGYSSNNAITSNMMTNDGVFIYGDELSHWNTHKIENNTVNEKPLYYFKDTIGCKVPEDAGQVILANCTGMLVENLNIRNTDIGIEIGFSSQITIKNNNVSDNRYGMYGIYLEYSSNSSIAGNSISNNRAGIYLWCSSNSSIAGNSISNNGYGISLIGSGKNSITGNNVLNNYDGICLDYSSDNFIYLNNFINNTDNVYSYNSTNIWNSKEPITYTYRGSEFTNYMGNYWDDYNGSDANGDGIGETPHIIDENNIDNYPLIERFENYFVPTPAQIFDTGRPENPYPSISGEFIGTIKANRKIIATKLYTYACEGTGGHTEYALICNKTWCAEAKWEGYKEDWMNISFNRTVILMPYETYNIALITGSYPQIHHKSALQTENGWINCTEFIDANGNKYEDWIPAIKLW